MSFGVLYQSSLIFVVALIYFIWRKQINKWIRSIFGIYDFTLPFFELVSAGKRHFVIYPVVCDRRVIFRVQHENITATNLGQYMPHGTLKAGSRVRRRKRNLRWIFYSLLNFITFFILLISTAYRWIYKVTTTPRCDAASQTHSPLATTPPPPAAV